MTMISAPDDHTALPAVPVPRDARCPLRPPPEFDDWRASEGLQKVLWRHEPTWFISRYEDIRAALTDPRLSADTLPEELKLMGVGDNVPVVFARIDDPEHNRLRRMMTRDFTFRRAQAMGPRSRNWSTGSSTTWSQRGRLPILFATSRCRCRRW